MNDSLHHACQLSNGKHMEPNKLGPLMTSNQVYQFICCPVQLSNLVDSFHFIIHKLKHQKMYLLLLTINRKSWMLLKTQDLHGWCKPHAIKVNGDITSVLILRSLQGRLKWFKRRLSKFMYATICIGFSSIILFEIKTF